MSYRYASKKGKSPRTEAPQAAAQAVSQTPGVPMETTRSMLMGKAMADRSHRIDLPDAMREKMEAAFGMNFGKVNLYESQKVADAGANAIAQGGNIAFAPGKADFNTADGRNRLGHELSHVAAQARGQVTGSGFLDNSALEARADREGALAASGEQVYSGSMTDAPSFSAAAPMQAEKKWKKGETWNEKKNRMAEMDDYIDRMMNIKKGLLSDEKLKDRMLPTVSPEDLKWYQRMIANPTEDFMEQLSVRKGGALWDAQMDATEHNVAWDDLDDDAKAKDKKNAAEYYASSGKFQDFLALQKVLDEIEDYHSPDGLQETKPEDMTKEQKRVHNMEKWSDSYGSNKRYRQGREEYETYSRKRAAAAEYDGGLFGGYDLDLSKKNESWRMPLLVDEKDEKAYDPDYKKKRDEKKNAELLEYLMEGLPTNPTQKKQSISSSKQKKQSGSSSKKKESKSGSGSQQGSANSGQAQGQPLSVDKQLQEAEKAKRLREEEEKQLRKQNKRKEGLQNHENLKKIEDGEELAQALKQKKSKSGSGVKQVPARVASDNQPPVSEASDDQQSEVDKRLDEMFNFTLARNNVQTALKSGAKKLRPNEKHLDVNKMKNNTQFLKKGEQLGPDFMRAIMDRIGFWENQTINDNKGKTMTAQQGLRSYGSGSMQKRDAYQSILKELAPSMNKEAQQLYHSMSKDEVAQKRVSEYRNVRESVSNAMSAKKYAPSKQQIERDLLDKSTEDFTAKIGDVGYRNRKK